MPLPVAKDKDGWIESKGAVKEEWMDRKQRIRRRKAVKD